MAQQVAVVTIGVATDDLHDALGEWLVEAKTQAGAIRKLRINELGD